MNRKSNIIHEEIMVGSSAIVAVTYTYEYNEMTVLFISGAKYKYLNVEPDVYIGMKYSDSVGKYFNRVIKDKYDFEILESTTEELV